MKCIVLTENTSYKEDLLYEHGLSLWIETEHHTILFDSGQSDVFYQNALKLNLDLNQVDICVLSHGHYDHAGGLKKFLEMNHHAKIYMHEKVFNSYWHGYDKYIGIDASLKDHARVVLIQDTLKLDENLTLIPCAQYEPVIPIESYGLYVKKDNEYIDDKFEHEILLQIDEDKKIVFSGCTHCGIENVMHWLKPDVLIGGFHLKKVDPVLKRNHLIDLAQTLKQYKTHYYTGHCTGEGQYFVMKEVLQNQLDEISAGFCMEV